MGFFLFIFGTAIGSFINVVALRYDPDKFLFGSQIKGRSACPGCGKKLSWYELIPVLSFVLQWGCCRSCHARISFRYPLVEILSGLIFVLVPVSFCSLGQMSDVSCQLSSVLWVFAFEALLLLSLIDLRHKLIPDETNLFIFAAGIVITFTGYHASSFVPYADIFGFSGNVLFNRAVAVAAAILIFGSLVVVTRGMGMGMGDVKLAAALAVLFGWPDIVFISAMAFVIGSLVGGYIIFARDGGLKSSVPFGPFLALASFIAFFWGGDMLGYYFSMFPIV